MWQRYLTNHLCRPVWRKFCESAAMIGINEFGSLDAMQKNFERYAPAEFMPPTWEWVDPQNEQKAATEAINNFQASYAEELGALGKNWRHVFYQRAKEEQLLKKLKLSSPMQQAEALADAQTANAEAVKINAEKAGVSED